MSDFPTFAPAVGLTAAGRGFRAGDCHARGGQALREEVRQDLKNRPKVYGGGGEVGLACPAGDVLATAEHYAKGMQDDYVSTEHNLLGLTESAEGRRLSQYGLTKDVILKALASIRGTQRVASQTPEDTFQALGDYGRDLTAQARQGKIDPVIGRAGNIDVDC